MSTNARWLLLAVVGIAVVLGIFYYRPAKLAEQPIADVSYVCDEGKSIAVAYYRGETKPAPTADLPPTHGGRIELTLSDGRTMILPQTVSADGGRYANPDESFVFWSKGNGASVLEGGEEGSYTGCILVAPQRDDTGLTQAYAHSGIGFSIRLPQGYSIDESYRYELGPGEDISGVKFTIPESLSSGTDLGNDTYISVESIPQASPCSANIFLGQESDERVMIDGEIQYIVASSTGAAAGNRYDETVYALQDTNPCIAVRYRIHYGVFENYVEGTVRQFDESALIRQFDEIRRTLIIVPVGMETASGIR